MINTVLNGCGKNLPQEGKGCKMKVLINPKTANKIIENEINWVHLEVYKAILDKKPCVIVKEDEYKFISGTCLSELINEGYKVKRLENGKFLIEWIYKVENPTKSEFK